MQQEGHVNLNTAPDNDTETEPPPARPQLVVNLVAPLRGPARSIGQRVIAAAKIALLEARERWGEQQAMPELYVLDSTQSPEHLSATLAARSQSEGLQTIVGPLENERALQLAPIARDQSMPMVALSPAAPRSLLGEGVLRLFVTPEAEARALAQVAHARGARRFAILFPDNAYGQSMQEAWRKVLQKHNLRLVIEESYPSGSTSFGPQVNAIKQARPDALFVVSDARTLISVAPALAAVGLWSQGAPEAKNQQSLTLLAPSITLRPRLLQHALRYLQGTFFAHPFPPTHLRKTQVQAFVQRMEGEFNQDADFFAAFAHDACAELLHAVYEKQAEDSDTLLDALQQSRLPRLSGRGSGFSAQGEALHVVDLVQLQGQQLIAVPAATP